MDEQFKLKPFRWVILSLAAIFLFSFVYYFFLSAPADFPQGSVVSIATGTSLGQTTYELRNAHFIRSSSVFQSLVILFGGEHKLIAGDYLFEERQNAIVLAWRFVHAQFGMSEAKVTIPEGFSNRQIGDLLARKLVQFNEDQFLTDAGQYEGYLFPDTYFFPPTATSSEIIGRMKGNFDVKIAPLELTITAFQKTSLGAGHSEADIITMASILEGEATSTVDREIIAGILWKRLKAGQPLEVDSTLKYITGKTSVQLTTADLANSSPYNTYNHRGLPPGPIDNPGINSITAALNPMTTAYNYFLTDADGGMHYAQTFSQHQKNIANYLQ